MVNDLVSKYRPLRCMEARGHNRDDDSDARMDSGVGTGSVLSVGPLPVGPGIRSGHCRPEIIGQIADC
jgi:hypothetical protein